MTKKTTEHEDILGQPITDGCYVAASHRNNMYVCKVIKVNPKMLRILDVKSKHESDQDGWLVYPSETVKLSGEDAIAFILKYA